MNPTLTLLILIFVVIISWLYAKREEIYFVQGIRIFVTAASLLEKSKSEVGPNFYLTSEDVVRSLKRRQDPALLFPPHIQAPLRQAIDEKRLHSGYGYL